MDSLKGTTILAVKKDGKTVVIGDGQVTMGQNSILKNNAIKVRRIFNSKVIVGFAGSVPDAFALSGRFEDMLNKYSGNILRSAVELAIAIRTDEILRKLEAQMIVADKDTLLMISGLGDVMEPDEGICSIGSGCNYAMSAAKALLRNTDLSAKEIALRSMEIASDICVYTNKSFVIEEV